LSKEVNATNTVNTELSSFESWLNSSTLALFLDANGESPLHYAAKANDRRLCELLVAFGFDVCLRNDRGLLPHELCYNAELKNMLSELARVREERALLVLRTQSLLEACKSGDLDAVKVNTLDLI
jgi:ankyrin repeat protein